MAYPLAMIGRRILLSILPFGTVSRAWAAASPPDIVAEVYRGSAGNADWDESFAKAMGRKRPFSKKFDALLRGADARSRKVDEPWLDFDPVSNSQDPSIHGLKISVVSDSPDATTISAEFRYDPGPASKVSRVTYDFVRENGAWALDDIKGDVQDSKDQNWSLRKMARDFVATRK
jgi:hypothetical protein